MNEYDGLPDFVGDVREILGDISDVFDDILAYAGMPLKCDHDVEAPSSRGSEVEPGFGAKAEEALVTPFRHVVGLIRQR
jgi:hypothetical protein